MHADCAARADTLWQLPHQQQHDVSTHPAISGTAASADVLQLPHLLPRMLNDRRLAAAGTACKYIS